MSETDLFGDVPSPAHKPGYTVPRGYYGPPGAGPAGETCGSCVHCLGRGHRYLKCAKARAKWTHGRATDILARSPACIGWEAQPATTGAKS